MRVCDLARSHANKSNAASISHGIIKGLKVIEVASHDALQKKSIMATHKRHGTYYTTDWFRAACGATSHLITVSNSPSTGHQKGMASGCILLLKHMLLHQLRLRFHTNVSVLSSRQSAFCFELDRHISICRVADQHQQLEKSGKRKGYMTRQGQAIFAQLQMQRM